MAEEHENKDLESAEEPCVTMQEYLEEEKEVEEEYYAVLGASDEKKCSYAQGPLKRQALYACMTCNPEARNNPEKYAGVCLACSYHCHENHELIELYTKRNFRCDCPTESYANVCVLNGKLSKPYSRNVDNKYDQNFKGLYCVCHRPYPDAERTTEEVMLQCAICEDWYHLSHLGLTGDVEKLADLAGEMICEGCMKKHDFIYDYKSYMLSVVEKETQENINSTNVEEVSEEPKAKQQKLDDQAVRSEGCTRPTKTHEKQEGACFWANDWRSALCKCAQCLELYKSEGVEFLLDPEDSAKSYEDRGFLRAKSDPANTYEEAIKALSSMDRVRTIDAITEYNHMKDKLKDFLQTFAHTNKVVTEQDITGFFQRMRDERLEQRI